MVIGNLFQRSPSSLSSLEKAKRDMALGLKRLPVVNWLYQTRDVNHLLLVPRDLRTADPSFSIEYDMGQFGLAGATVLLEDRSPFFVEAPNKAWARELHGFGWLRHLRAARSERAQEQALDLFEQWLKNFRRQKGVAFEVDVVARRLISWLSHSNFLLQTADEPLYMGMMIAIDDHMRYLSMAEAHAGPGMPRLLALVALVFAGLSVANQEKFLDQQIRLLCLELDKQILSDGGHVSRNNAVLASILLDLLPMRQCFVTRKMEVPPVLQDAIERMMPMINFMRLGDGLMSRFNGAGTTLPDTLSTAMAYDDVTNHALREASASKYFRLQQGNVIVLMDGGAPPQLGLSQKAHAGCLSFEMSSGTCPLIINCGAAPPAFHTMAHNARATVSHSTLTINNRSSARFLHDSKPKSGEHNSLLEGPRGVTATYETKADQHKIVASHDGYLEQFGLVHHRLLSLSHDGYALIGEDWIETPQGRDVLQRGLGWPYAVHFHIHPDVVPSRAADGKSIELTLADSQVWTFSAHEQVVHLEESIFYADFAGPCQSVQIVIRGNCMGPVSIPWKLVKKISAPSPDPGKIPSWISGNVVPIEKAKDDGSGERGETSKATEGAGEQPPQEKSPDKTQGDKTRREKARDDKASAITDLVEEAEPEKAQPPRTGKKRRRRKAQPTKRFGDLSARKPMGDNDRQPPPPPGQKDKPKSLADRLAAMDSQRPDGMPPLPPKGRGPERKPETIRGTGGEKKPPEPAGNKGGKPDNEEQD